MTTPDITQIVKDSLYCSTTVRVDDIRPDMKLVAPPLDCDELDIMELCCDAEEELDIDISVEDETSLQDPHTTVQTAIDLFAKLYNQQSNRNTGAAVQQP